jgi:N-acetylneuraminate synthase
MKNCQSSVYIIAEAGVNHNGSIDMAKQLVDAAVAAGADAVKFQTFKAENLVTADAPKAEYQMQHTEPQESQFSMLKKLELDENAHRILRTYCDERGIEFLSTPFDTQSVDLLAKELKVGKLKIASGDLTNAPLLLYVADSAKSVILSTGMSTLDEVEEALGVLAFGYLHSAGTIPSRESFRQAFQSESGQELLKEKVSLLHCTTEYPAPFSEVNLRAMDTLRDAFGVPVGLSDHTPGYVVALAAVARGATIIEKHFTLDRGLPGPDHKASLEPDELKAMVAGIRQIEMALGSGHKEPTPSEMKNRVIARKSLVAGQFIRRGELFTAENITCKRTGKGIAPIHYWEWLGKQANCDYTKDEPIQ